MYEHNSERSTCVKGKTSILSSFVKLSVEIEKLNSEKNECTCIGLNASGEKKSYRLAPSPALEKSIRKNLRLLTLVVWECASKVKSSHFKWSNNSLGIDLCGKEKRVSP
jgi:hypothetical protein